MERKEKSAGFFLLLFLFFLLGIFWRCGFSVHGKIWFCVNGKIWFCVNGKIWFCVNGKILFCVNGKILFCVNGKILFCVNGKILFCVTDIWFFVFCLVLFSRRGVISLRFQKRVTFTQYIIQILFCG